MDNQQTLTSFIGVRMLGLVAQALQNVTVDDLPGKRDDLTDQQRTYYREMYEFCHGDLDLLEKML